MLLRLIKTVVITLITLSVFEVYIRLDMQTTGRAASQKALENNVESGSISKREEYTKYILHNLALLKSLDRKDHIRSAFFGTSRTKYVSPHRFAGQDSIVLASNSYNEMPYRIIAEAEILLKELPSVQTVFFEASFLQRRPFQSHVEPDHEKYLYALRELDGVFEELPATKNFLADLKSESNASTSWFRLQMFEARFNLRLSAFFGLTGKTAPASLMHLPEMTSIDEHGERVSFAAVDMDREVKPIMPGNAKIEVIKTAVRNIPGDHLFELLTHWAAKKGVQLVLFEPPTRNDYYDASVRLGLKDHQSDLVRISKKAGVPLIQLNGPNFNVNARLFSDEDHLGTCLGSALLTAGIVTGYEKWRKTGELLPKVSVEEAMVQLDKGVNACENVRGNVGLVLPN